MTRYLTRLHTYYCDSGDCNISYEDEGQAKDVWQIARKDGWRALKGGRHHCPLHASSHGATGA